MFRFKPVLLILLSVYSVLALQAATVSGTVSSAGNGLPAVTVLLQDSYGLVFREALTDAQGAYTLINVPNGDYNLMFRHAVGHADSFVNPITVDGQDVTYDVILLAGKVSLNGRITDSDGNGVPGVTVTVSGTASESTASLSDGRYELFLAAGTYDVVLSSTNDGTGADPLPNFFSFTAAKDREILSTNSINYELPPVVRVYGTVNGSTGPLGQVPITTGTNLSEVIQNPDGTVTLLSNSFTSEALSSSTGSYEIFVFARKELTYQLGLSFTNPSVPNLSFNQSVTIRPWEPEVEQDLTLASSAIVSGRVLLADGTPAVGTSVRLSGNGNTNISSLVDPTGAWEVAVLAGRTWTVTVANVEQPLLPSSFNIRSISVTPTADTVMDDIVLPPAFPVQGHIRDDQGVGIPDVAVDFTSNGDNMSWASPTTDANGFYSTYLFEGTLFVIVRPDYSSGYIPQWHSQLPFPQGTPLDFVLEGDGTPPTGDVTIQGIITDAAGVEINGPLINGRVCFATGGFWEQPICADINDQGYYTATLPAGSYGIRIDARASASDGDGGGGEEGKVRMTQDLPPTFEATLYTSFNLSSNLTLDYALPPTSRLTGIAQDGNGTPVEGITVSLNGEWHEQNGSSIRVRGEASSGSDGTYGMTLFSHNNYTAVVAPPPGSGFGGTQLDNVDLSSDLFQTVVVDNSDDQAPNFVRQPRLLAAGGTTALFGWETSEPSTTELLFGETNPPTTPATRDGLVHNHELSLNGLTPNTTYYVQARANDAFGNGPALSNVVEFQTTGAEDQDPPLITNGPIAFLVRQTSFTITWETNEPSNSVVTYWSGSNAQSQVVSEELVLNHSVSVQGLEPGTFYFFTVSSTDAVGNGPTTSPEKLVRTLVEPDYAAPKIIGGPLVLSKSDDSVVIGWITDEPATSAVSMNDGTNYFTYSDANLVTEHIVQFTGLTANTTYVFRVSSRDEQGNGPTVSDEMRFTTLVTGDTDPPVITTQPTVLGLTNTSATIKWRTDEPADAAVNFGLTDGSMDQQVLRASLKKNHVLHLTGLSPGTTYFFQTENTDAVGNGPTNSRVYSFTTKSTNDTVAPVFTEAPTIVDLTDTTVTIAFETDEPATSRISILNDVGIQVLEKSDGTLRKKHQVTITGLEAGEVYSADVVCHDFAGNRGETVRATLPIVARGTNSFTTDSEADTTAPSLLATPMASSIAYNSALITWETNELSETRLSYEVNGSGQETFIGDTGLKTKHAIMLTNLQSSTIYIVRPTTLDLAGNAGAGQVINFETLSGGVSPAPVVSNVNVVTGEYTATITWTSSSFTTSQVNYGSDAGNLIEQSSEIDLTTSHSIELTNLLPGTTYYYQASGYDSVSMQGSSEVLQFTTDALSETDLSLDASLLQASNLEVGGTFRMTATITNNGPATATNVTAAISIPEGQGLSLIFNDGDFNPITGVWEMEPIAAAGSHTLNLDFQAQAMIANSVQITLEITGGDLTDPDSTPGNGVGNQEDDEAVLELTTVPYLVIADGLKALLVADLNIDLFADGELTQSEVNNVTTLDVSGSGLTSAEGLEYFSNLVSLDLSDNDLTWLPDMRNLGLMTDLNVSMNPLGDLQTGQGTQALPISLITFNASETGLSTFPGLLLEMPFLENLNLDGNHLVTLPDNLDVMPALSDLSVNACNLTSLGIGIGSMTTLTSLQARDNLLENMPTWGNGMPLATLDVGYNRLASLGSLAGLTQLGVLKARYNQLVSLGDLDVHATLGTLAGHMIDLEHNQLSNVWCDVFALYQGRVDISGATFIYDTQGNFGDLWTSLPAWEPGTDLFSWISQLSDGSLNENVGCP